MLAEEALTLVWPGGGGEAGKRTANWLKGLRQLLYVIREGFLEAVTVELDLRGRERCDGKRHSLGGWMLSPLLNLESRARDCLSPPGVE